MEEPGDVDARFFFGNICVLGMKKQRVIFFIENWYMVNNSSSRKRYASPKAGTELYLDLVFRQ